ncbi:MAG: ABC transporter permease [Actinomycetota bacterium]
MTDAIDEATESVVDSPVDSDVVDSLEEQAAAAEVKELGEYRSLRQDVWRQFRRHKGAMAALFILTVITIGAVLGPEIYPYDPFELDIENANQTPSWSNPFGTDNLGRDVLARALIGGRISLAVGFAAMAFSLVLGVGVGILAGFFRRLDGLLMRFTDLVISLPQLPLLLLVIVLFREPLKDTFGPSLGIFLLVVAIIGATSWMQTARIVRGHVLALKEEEFVLAARSVGTKDRRILSRHILANVLSPVTVSASLGIATAIITESALSFLGLGFPADFPTWGRLLFDAKDYMRINLWRVLLPGFLISTTVIAVNFIGDGLRDALDPRLRSKS